MQNTAKQYNPISIASSDTRPGNKHSTMLLSQHEVILHFVDTVYTYHLTLRTQ